MSYISEALKVLNEMSNTNPEVIKITANITPELEEEILPTGKIEDIYDEQLLEDWYDFASTVEGIIDNMGNIVNIALSKHPNSLSEYIDFYSYDSEGNQKEYLIDLRLSTHGATSNARAVRKNHANKLDNNYVLKSVIVNDKQFNSYDEAIVYIRKFLAKELMK